jgi:hypothetical protein
MARGPPPSSLPHWVASPSPPWRSKPPVHTAECPRTWISIPIASAQSPNRPEPESLLHVADYHERIPDHGEPRPADARGVPMSNYLPRGTLHFEDWPTKMTEATIHAAVL